MKTQKEAVALKLQIDKLKEMQREQRERSRRAEMEREGIPMDGQVEKFNRSSDFLERNRGKIMEGKVIMKSGPVAKSTI